MDNEQFEQRKEKLNELRTLGVNPFANGYKPDNLAGELLSKFGETPANELESLNEDYSLAGRVVALRDFGKSVFFHIADRSGKIQGYLKTDVVGEDKLKFFKRYMDLGDFIGISGKPVQDENRASSPSMSRSSSSSRKRSTRSPRSGMGSRMWKPGTVSVI